MSNQECSEKLTSNTYVGDIFGGTSSKSAIECRVYGKEESRDQEHFFVAKLIKNILEIPKT